MQNIRVLIIDDDPSILQSMALVLESEPGFQTMTLIDALQWRTAIEKFKPDVVLVDFKMPQMSGAELLAALNQADVRSGVKSVVLFSASPIGRKRAIEMGADDFFSKPFDIDYVIQRVKDLVQIGPAH